MAFASGGLSYAFEAQGELGFAWWAYGTNDRLEQVLEPNYFRTMHHRMRVGDMIVVGTTPRRAGSPWRNATGETRRALLMVSLVDPGGLVHVRLVQDYGRPENPSAAVEAVPSEPPRKRGRPRKQPADACGSPG